MKNLQRQSKVLLIVVVLSNTVLGMNILSHFTVTQQQGNSSQFGTNKQLRGSSDTIKRLNETIKPKVRNIMRLVTFAGERCVFQFSDLKKLV